MAGTNNMEPGQLALVADLEELLEEAKAGEFGDFTNKKYAAPKLMLYSKLSVLLEYVKAGKYD